MELQGIVIFAPETGTICILEQAVYYLKNIIQYGSSVRACVKNLDKSY